jgi:hypothetical protein
MTRTLTIEDVLLFMEELRLDETRRHLMNGGGDLLREAAHQGLLEWGQFSEFEARMRELKRDGLADWKQADWDRFDHDLMNASEFHLTTEGRREARAIEALPSRLRPQGCEEALAELGWTSALDELREGDDQFRQGHWSDAVGDYYTSVESGLKYSLEAVGAEYGSGAALKMLARRAREVGLIPPNYQETFGFLDSIRSPREHGQGTTPNRVEVEAAEALLMGNHARSLLLYLAQRVGRGKQPNMASRPS